MPISKPATPEAQLAELTEALQCAKTLRRLHLIEESDEELTRRYVQTHSELREFLQDVAHKIASTFQKS